RGIGGGGGTVLSPFEVTSAKDVGYQAGNSMSGSRLNSSLKDTAAAVMVFTPEFLSDFGATSLADLIGYAPNMQVDMLDASADAGTSFLGGSDLRDTRIRVRGLSASTALDFFETGIAVDTYNTERLELSGGPNSILFGFGSPGGLVNIMTKRAQVARNRTSFRTQFGEFDHRRFDLDHNQLIIPGKVALRLNGLLQDSGGWRRWDYNDSSRGALSLRINPWGNTTVVVNYENGQMKSHVTRPLNAFDSLALWQASGSGILNDAVWTTANRAAGINRTTAVKNIYITNGSGAAPFVVTTRNAANFRLLESTYDDLNVSADARAGLSMVPASQIPFRYSTYGPGAGRDTNFDRALAVAEQRLTPTMTLEFAYNRERSKQWVKAPVNNSVLFTGDPNTVIPDPAGGPTPVANPNARALYLESRWVIDRGQTGNDVFRGSLAWDVDLGGFGKHNLAGMAEHGNLTAFRYPGVEILVDTNGVPIGNDALPENAANFVFRRQYVTPGNFDTYFVGKGTEDFTVVRDGKTYHNTFINSSVAGGFIGRTVDTLLAATQSAFLDSRLVVTAGLRGDRIRFDQHGDTRLSADDPDVRAGRAIRNTVKFTREVVDQTEFKPVTSTLGGVYHATKVFSVFYNHANNNAQPPLNARVLPDEKLPPPFDGLSDDYGLMLNLLDGKAFLRATAFQTSQRKSSGGTFGIGLNSGENNLVAPTTRILDTLLAARRITAAEYTEHLIGDEANLTGTSDIVNRGYELSTWFNVTRNFTAVLNFSYTRTDRSSIVPEFEGWFDRENAFWHRVAGSGSLVNSASGSTIDQEAANLQRVVAGIREFYNFGYGERPYKGNLSGRYSFTEGKLRGAFVGSGIRWQGASKLGRALGPRAPNGNRTFGETYYGPEDFKMDAFAGYRHRLAIGRFKSDLTVQLNVTNLTDEDEVMPLRYNNFKSGYTRVLLFEPRKFRLTMGLGF
ncbi:MAG: TonB-dependent receptor plug domain-containing protein, partial [Opitutaceae bacterium]